MLQCSWVHEYISVRPCFRFFSVTSCFSNVKNKNAPTKYILQGNRAVNVQRAPSSVRREAQHGRVLGKMTSTARQKLAGGEAGEGPEGAAAQGQGKHTQAPHSPAPSTEEVQVRLVQGSARR